MLTPDEEKIIAAHSRVLLRLLDDQETKILNKLYVDFQQGERDSAQAVTQFATIRNLKKEVEKTTRKQEEQ